MGIEDRDYYRERYAKRQGMRYNAAKGTYSSAQDWYDPKQYRTYVEDGPEPEPGETKRPPPKRPSVAQKAADRGSGPPDIPGSNLPWYMQALIYAALTFTCVTAYKLLIGKKPRIAPNPVVTAPASVPESAPVPIYRPQRPQVDTAAQQEKMQRRQLEDQRAAAAHAAHIAKTKDRDARWKRFYQPSPPCRSNPGTVDCANEFIRARRAFDASNE